MNGLGDNRHNWSSSEVSSPRHKAKALPVLPLRFMAEGLGRSLRHVQSPPHQPVLAKGMGTLVAGVGSWSRLIFLEVSFRAPVQVLPSLPAPRRGGWHRFLSHAGANSFRGPLLSQPSPGSQQEGCFSLDTSTRFAPLAGEQGHGGGPNPNAVRFGGPESAETLPQSTGCRQSPAPQTPAAGQNLAGADSREHPPGVGHGTGGGTSPSCPTPVTAIERPCCKSDEAQPWRPSIDFRCLTTGKLYNPIN